MSWKEFLTNMNPFKSDKTNKPKRIKTGGRKSADDPIEPLMEVKEAVKTIPSELLKELDHYKSIHTQNTKLNQEQQLELMEFIARFATMDEINAHFFSEYKIMLSPPLIYQYKRTAKWKPIIKKLREKYLLGEDEVAGRHKRVRLDRADKIYNKAYSKGDLKTALQANRDQQEMVEGRHVHGDTNLQFNQYNVFSDEELQERKKELLEKLNRNTIEVKSEKVENNE